MPFALADCNNFYVSCERAFNPRLQGRPVVVLSNNDGCVISRSDEAKALGISMGLPLFKARDLINRHKITVLSSNYALYGSLSRRVMDVMSTFPVDREVYSIDEAFLKLPESAPEALTTLCGDLRSRILTWTGIPVSIGIGDTKTLAKLANRLVKKQAVAAGVVNLLESELIDAALVDIPAGDVWGVGRNIRKALEKAGIHTAAQLRDVDTFWMRTEFGIKGLALVLELRGQVCSELQRQQGERKEIIVSRTFGQRLRGFDQLAPAYKEFARRGAERLAAAGMAAKSVTAYVVMDRYRPDYQGGSSVKLDLEVSATDSDSLIFFGLEALKKIVVPDREYRKGGLILGDLTPAHIVQDTLFNALAGDSETKAINTARNRGTAGNLSKAISAIHEKHGAAKLQYGQRETAPLWEQKRAYISPRYTTQWSEIPKAR